MKPKAMKKIDKFPSRLRPALVLFLIMTILLGVLYPLVVTAIAQAAFPAQANGSMVMNGNTITGSALLGQANTDSRYFWPRPSATDYNPLPSGASNQGPTSSVLAEQVRQRAFDFQVANGLQASVAVPADMLFASGSGLDPHISPDAARLQIQRVAQARGLEAAKIAQLVESQTEPPQLGLLGRPRINVLLLNMALDRLE